MVDVADICKKAKAASYSLAALGAAEKNAMLSAVAEALGREDSRERVKSANAVDVAAARANGLGEVFIDRLTVTDARIDDMIEGVRQIAALPDPVGRWWSTAPFRTDWISSASALRSAS